MTEKQPVLQDGERLTAEQTAERFVYVQKHEHFWIQTHSESLGYEHYVYHYRCHCGAVYERSN